MTGSELVDAVVEAWEKDDADPTVAGDARIALVTVAAWLRERAKIHMDAARSAALYEAWDTAGDLRKKATVMRDIASELEETK